MVFENCLIYLDSSTNDFVSLKCPDIFIILCGGKTSLYQRLSIHPYLVSPSPIFFCSLTTCAVSSFLDEHALAVFRRVSLRVAPNFENKQLDQEEKRENN